MNMSSLSRSTFDTYLAAETLLTLKEGTDSRHERKNHISSSNVPLNEEAENNDYEQVHLKRKSTMSSNNGTAANKSSKHKNSYGNWKVKASESVSLLSNRGVIRSCKVCGDITKRKHYGAVTCEGCKCFFRRSVLGKCVFRCHTGFMCIINKESRNNCGACRFVRCIDCGMLPEAVGVITSRKKLAESKYWNYSLRERKYQAVIHGNIQ